MNLPLSPMRPVLVMGAAVGDIVLNVPRLPKTGEDCVAQEADRQVGGCAFNVARALRRLGVEVINGLPVGNGPWGERIEDEMAALGMPVQLRHPHLDNGWCLAMVEPDGERTFVSVSGCEADWLTTSPRSLPLTPGTLVYANGYELAGTNGAPLRDWLVDLPREQLRLIDLGPWLERIEPAFYQALAGTHTLLSLNRQETAVLCGPGEPVKAAQSLAERYGFTVLCRLDRDGVWICQPGLPPEHVCAYPATVVDSVGAGDAHCGGVLAGLASGWSLAHACDLGNRVAACVIEQVGASGAPDAQQLQQRFHLISN